MGPRRPRSRPQEGGPLLFDTRQLSAPPKASLPLPASVAEQGPCGHPGVGGMRRRTGLLPGAESHSFTHSFELLRDHRTPGPTEHAPANALKKQMRDSACPQRVASLHNERTLKPRCKGWVTTNDTLCLSFPIRKGDRRGTSLMCCGTAAVNVSFSYFYGQAACT